MIRKIERRDISGVGELMRAFKLESFNKTYAYMDEKTIDKRINEAVDHDIPITYVADVNNLIVGMIAGIVIPSYTDESKNMGMELVWIVNKGYRSKSIGMRLFMVLEEEMFKRGADSVIFTAGSYSVLTDNSHKLADVYKRNGYSKLEIHYIKNKA